MSDLPPKFARSKMNFLLFSANLEVRMDAAPFREIARQHSPLTTTLRHKRHRICLWFQVLFFQIELVKYRWGIFFVYKILFVGQEHCLIEAPQHAAWNIWCVCLYITACRAKASALFPKRVLKKVSRKGEILIECYVIQNPMVPLVCSMRDS